MSMYPRDRLLAFLAKIANEPGPDLEPRNWLEYYLDKIAENGGGGGCGCRLKFIDSADINSYSGTVDGEPFNSDTDSLNINGTTYAPFVYGFIDSAEAPFAVTSTMPMPTGETLDIITYSQRFETFDNFQASGLHSGFYLESADKVIIARDTPESTDAALVLVVGDFVIRHVS